MNSKDLVQWLLRYRTAELEMEQTADNLQHWRDLATRAGASFVVVHTSGGGTERVAQAAEQVMALEETLLGRLGTLAEVQREIEAAVDRLADARHRLVLRYRYIDCLTWERVAERLYFSNQHVHRLHNEALAMLRNEVMVCYGRQAV